VRSTERSFGLNEEITLMGELYNQTFQSVANQEISVLIRDEDGKDLKRLMDPMGSNYMMRIKNLPPGLYNFRAETELGAELLEDHGYFTVYEQDLEQVDLTANHQLLKQIAGQTEGKYFNWESRSKLAVELEENEAMKIQIIEQESLNELISLKWVFWLLLGLLSMEWLIRKIIGGY
jgi:hypothetical protein